MACSGDDKGAGNYDAIDYAAYVEAHLAKTGGAAIGVLTVAGEIVDGEAGPGTAGGDSLSKAMLDGLAKNDLKALVVRVDSPGGSAFASEQIRAAILQAKAKGLRVRSEEHTSELQSLMRKSYAVSYWNKKKYDDNT